MMNNYQLVKKSDLILKDGKINFFYNNDLIKEKYCRFCMTQTIYKWITKINIKFNQ